MVVYYVAVGWKPLKRPHAILSVPLKCQFQVYNPLKVSMFVHGGQIYSFENKRISVFTLHIIGAKYEEEKDKRFCNIFGHVSNRIYVRNYILLLLPLSTL